MNQPVDCEHALTSGQLVVIRDLVGNAIAREDLPALEAAYRDFRAGMDELKSSFEQLTLASDQAGSADQSGAPHQGVKP
ncbi:hypothetical protein [Pseudarthrobacter sp. NBSH8]|uniref:hypothetical protein n=1 Tax=Pseudarthrobacter sp. NBSH8 TaxID=2596911 RepID=UPI0016290840|nr:hypothetical protein [Pseudarthrobacter sp. NBSH8]QNE15910.1 hypothetical protein FYJ92_16830 [Pseudarthrobacter sp. NBSH8]